MHNNSVTAFAVNRIRISQAYWYNGFHEDGVHSIDVTKRFGLDLSTSSAQWTRISSIQHRKIASEQSEEFSGIYCETSDIVSAFWWYPREFSYQLYMMGLDLDELPKTTESEVRCLGLLVQPDSLCRIDYLAEKEENTISDEPKSLKTTYASKVQKKLRRLVWWKPSNNACSMSTLGACF